MTAYRRYKKNYKKYSKKFNKLEKNYGGTSMLDKSFTVRDIATSALKGVAYIKGLVNSELYKHDFASNFYPLTSGTSVAIMAVPQGDGDSGRTGNSIFVRSININYNILWNSAGAIGQVVRCWLILDTQQTSDETSVTFSDIFNSNDVNSQLNAANVGRFKILKRTTHIMSSNNPKIEYNLYKTMRHHVRFNGSGSSDVQKGAIFWVVCSDSATNAPLVTYSGRVSYHDN